ncbi:MAG: MBL fold metallo-hydrolase [Woeseiaceae bacterium]|nr:MBL fold metallo-hydrolase [Woeseiaceae bacterium]
MTSPRYEFDTVPSPGETQTIAPGLEWLRMPLPLALNHINLWLLEDGDQWIVVDTGMFTDDAKAVWQDVFDTVFEGRSIRHVIVTHLHPDHAGCAGWLTERAGCDLWMTREEYLLCRLLVADTGRKAPEEGLHFYRAAGFSEEALDAYQRIFGFFGRYISELPEAYHRIAEDDVLSIGGRDWRVIIGRGHSPEHACLYNESDNLLISGDQLLPTISSNVGVYPTEPDANPLKVWMSTLENLKQQTDPDVLVLPAHGKPFRGAHERLDTLIHGHEQGLETLVEYCEEPRRAVDVFPALFKREVGADSMIIATGEALAHLHYLVEAGEVEKRDDDSGVSWFTRVSS